ncbi:MAG: LysR family transcriptional regulator [Betaproteobacteria bacterium]|nr:LysR family transcriptional regulator [Betaproteobacteria bacterium]
MAKQHWSLDFTTIETIVAAAEEGSISRAAKRTHLALAAASRRISEFEQRIGMKIFDRQARGVRVTKAAEPLLNHIQALLAGLGRLSGAVEDIRQGVTEHLRLLANSSVIAELLPELLSEFVAAHPHVRVEVEELSSSDIVRSVVERRASIGVLWADVGTRGLVATPVGEDELLIVAPREHPLAGRRSVRFVETLAFDYVMFETGSPMYLWLTREAGKLSAVLRGRIQVRGLDAVCRMVEAGLGIGVIPRRAAEVFSKSMRIRLISLREPWARRQFCIVYRGQAQLAPVERQFLFLAERRWSHCAHPKR